MAFGSVQGQKSFTPEDLNKNFVSLGAIYLGNQVSTSQDICITPNQKYVFVGNKSGANWDVYDTSMEKLLNIILIPLLAAQ